MDALNKLRARQTEIREALQELDSDAGGEQFTDAQRDEWNRLNAELETNEKHIVELDARMKRLTELTEAGSVEREEKPAFRGRPAQKTHVPEDPTNLTDYRRTTSSIDELHDAYLEGALRITERMVPAHPDVRREDAQERVEKLLRQHDNPDGREIARRIIATSSPVYERAFAKYISGKQLNREEQAAAERSFTIGSTGNYPVPAVWDPTVILASSGVINPIRRLARVETITGNTWYGVISGGITASYDAEATEVSDDTPTLTQPTLNVEKAQAFVPFSIEAGEDWGSLRAEMAREFADAKDTLESNKFLHGLGHASNEPLGLLAAGGATAVITSASTATFAVADLFSLEAALGPRWRARASFAGNKAAYQKIRQFDTDGGANLWTQLQFGEPANLIGYPALEWSDYASTTTTTGSTILTFGDFSKYLVLDRVGLDVELIPHLFSTVAGRPLGMRGLYCYWRNTGAPLIAGHQANPAFVSLKLL
jgi:HK97 family phage major capsid protein